MARRLLFFAIAACLTCSFAWSKQDDEKYTRLARLSYLEGNVSYQHPSEVDWSAASINLPLEPGDRIYVGDEGRAEIQFDDGSCFRLAENTDVEILSLREDLIQLRIMVGLATLTVSGDADFEINTPAAAFNALRDGVYRFDIIENGDTDAIVRKGELEAANNEMAERIRAGELFHFTLGRRKPEISRYNRRDEWDEWNDRRTADTRLAGNMRYLPDNVYMGASELDRHGRWVSVEEYGNAWIPYDLEPDWSPYAIGRWCYRPLFGWTWVSYEPWGWLPYHYGRWYHTPRYGWCWLPGPSFAFNFWSPALVSFYHGSGWVSWCPLGPGDYYEINNYHYNHGIYRHQLEELRRLHTRGPGDHFNRDVRGAFRSVQLDQFRNGSFDRDRLRNTRWGNLERPWKEGSLVRDRLNIQPTSTSFAAVPGRPAAKPREPRAVPTVLRSEPQYRSESNGRFTRITNPQIPAATSRGARSRFEDNNSRTIQVPRNAEPGSSDPGERRVLRSRGVESGRTGENNNRDRGVNPPPVRSDNPTSPDQQNPSRNRTERLSPGRPSDQQSAPAARPRSESGRRDNFGEARPGVGRWSESNPGSRDYVPPYRPQGSRTQGNWNVTPAAPAQGRDNAPAYSAPESGAEGRGRSSRAEPDSGNAHRQNNIGRWGGSGDSGRNSAPRQSSPSFERGGGRPSSAPSGNSNQNSGGGERGNGPGRHR